MTTEPHLPQIDPVEVRRLTENLNAGELYVLIAYYVPDRRWADKGCFTGVDSAERAAERLSDGWTGKRIVKVTVP